MDIKILEGKEFAVNTTREIKSLIKVFTGAIKEIKRDIERAVKL